MTKRRANGEGNLRKRSDGRWEGRYTAGYDPDTGKRIIKNVLGRTQAEAKEKLKAAVEQAQQVDVTRTDEYTVATWLRTWYDLYAQPNIRTATADRYRLMIETYTIPRIGKIKLKKLTSRDLQKMYKNLMEHGRVNTRSGHGNPGLSSTTVRSVHLMLHSAFERAVKERLIARNPTDDCIAPKVQKVEMKTLRPEHLKAYLDAADARGVLPMFYLELVSGLRKGELVALLWDDLDIQNRTISVSKQYIKNPSGKLTLSRPKTETSVRRVSIPPGGGRPADPGAREAPGKPVYVPLQYHRGNVLPRLRGKAPREDPQGRWTGAHPLPRSETHLRHPGAAERRGYQDGFQYAGALRRGLHPAHLHPRHPPDAGSSSRNHGKLHDPDDVAHSEMQSKHRAGRPNFLPGAL